MNSLNIIVDFSTYMYFRELKDLARYGMFSATLVTEVIQGLGNVTLSWTSHSPRIMLCYDMFRVVMFVGQVCG